MLYLFLVPARSPSSPVPADCSLANSTDLSLTTGSSAGWQEQGPCLALPSNNLWSPSGRGILGLHCPGEGHRIVLAGMMAQCCWRGKDLPALCCFLFLPSSRSMSPFPPTSSHHTFGQPGWGEAGGSGSSRDKFVFPIVFFLLFLWRSTTASEATNRRGQEPGGGWWSS